MNQHDRALDELTSITKKFPNNSEIYYNIGEISRETFRMKPAYKSYQQALDLNPLYSEAIFAKGQIMFAQGHYHKASSYFGLAETFKIDEIKYHVAGVINHIAVADKKVKSKLIREVIDKLNSNSFGGYVAPRVGIVGNHVISYAMILADLAENQNQVTLSI